MSTEEEFEKISRGALRKGAGQTLEGELKRLGAAIETLAQTINKGANMAKEQYLLLKAEMEGLSKKLDAKASQSSIDELKTDSNTIKNKLDVLIQNKNLDGPR